MKKIIMSHFMQSDAYSLCDVIGRSVPSEKYWFWYKDYV